MTNQITDYVIIGCGGTGYSLAEPLLRMIMPQKKANLWLIDGKTVRSQNMMRQFGLSDVGINKAVALKNHISRILDPKTTGIKITAIPHYLEPALIGSHREWLSAEHIAVFCCIDSKAGRVYFEDLLSERRNVVYIDAGNEEWDGQAVFYQKVDGKELYPRPTEINPELLENDNRMPSQIPCDELAVSSPQFAVANMAAALSALMLWTAKIHVTDNSVGDKSTNYVVFDTRSPCMLPKVRQALASL